MTSNVTVVTRDHDAADPSDRAAWWVLRFQKTASGGRTKRVDSTLTESAYPPFPGISRRLEPAHDS